MSTPPKRKREKVQDPPEETSPSSEEQSKPSKKQRVKDTTPSEEQLDIQFNPHVRLEELDTNFDSLAIDSKTLKAIGDLGFKTMTEVQARSIPVLLVCFDEYYSIF